MARSKVAAADRGDGAQHVAARRPSSATGVTVNTTAVRSPFRCSVNGAPAGVTVQPVGHLSAQRSRLRRSVALLCRRTATRRGGPRRDAARPRAANRAPRSRRAPPRTLRRSSPRTWSTSRILHRLRSVTARPPISACTSARHERAGERHRPRVRRRATRTWHPRAASQASTAASVARRPATVSRNASVRSAVSRKKRAMKLLASGWPAARLGRSTRPGVRSVDRRDASPSTAGRGTRARCTPNDSPAAMVSASDTASTTVPDAAAARPRIALLDAPAGSPPRPSRRPRPASFAAPPRAARIALSASASAGTVAAGCAALNSLDRPRRRRGRSPPVRSRARRRAGPPARPVRAATCRCRRTRWFRRARSSRRLSSRMQPRLLRARATRARPSPATCAGCALRRRSRSSCARCRGSNAPGLDPRRRLVAGAGPEAHAAIQLPRLPRPQPFLELLGELRGSAAALNASGVSLPASWCCPWPSAGVP